MSNKDRNIVFSTNPDWSDTSDSGTSAKKDIPPRQQTAYIRRESKGRKGKTVTVVSNLQGDLKALQKDLQKHCGSGGTLKNGNMEIQGDHREKVAGYLRDRGYKVKLSGG